MWNISRANFIYVFVDLSNIKVIFFKKEGSSGVFSEEMGGLVRPGR